MLNKAEEQATADAINEWASKNQSTISKAVNVVDDWGKKDPVLKSNLVSFVTVVGGCWAGAALAPTALVLGSIGYTAFHASANITDKLHTRWTRKSRSERLKERMEDAIRSGGEE